MPGINTSYLHKAGDELGFVTMPYIIYRRNFMNNNVDNEIDDVCIINTNTTSNTDSKFKDMVSDFIQVAESAGYSVIVRIAEFEINKN